MEAANTTAIVEHQTAAAETVSAEEGAARALHKRYEGLVMVRTKAVKGKGAWYWAHLEPILVRSADNGLPAAVKLRCSLCDSVFSASNPSRTASEHLKRRACPGFITSSSSVVAVSSVEPVSSLAPPNHRHRHRKRSSTAAISRSPPPSLTSGNGDLCHATPLSVVDPSRFSGGGELGYATPARNGREGGGMLPQQPHLVLSGGKHDLGALAMLEESVKKLKSPKTSPAPKLSKTQIESAVNHLAGWIYETCGSVSFSGLEHPKFKAFLNQVGLPAISGRELISSGLNAKYEEAKAEAEVKIREANFFQIATNGWKAKSLETNLVNFTVNLPNGTSLYKKADFVNANVPSDYAEERLSETITGICGNSLQKCVGIVSDRFKANALRNLESRYPWMITLSCQFQGFISLIKDFNKELPLFKRVTESCLRLASFVNNTTRARLIFSKYQTEEHGYCSLLRLPLRLHIYDNVNNFESMYNLLEDIMNSARALQLVVLDDAYKGLAMEDPIAREIGELIGELGFWNEIEAVYSLVKLTKEMAQKIEKERPLVGQCIPLWDELRAKVRDWCSKFLAARENVEEVIEKRFNGNYRPAWAAGFILDPLYLVRDNCGKYLPPFKFLTAEQEKDVDRLITRLVSKEEAHLALMELMKWRTEGLDPVYARAVQMKERDPVTGMMKFANPQGSRLVWETHLSEFRVLGKIAVRVIFLHASSCGFKCNSSLLRWVNNAERNSPRAAIDRAQKLIYVAANSRFERRDFSGHDDEKDFELLGSENGENHMLNGVFS